MSLLNSSQNSTGYIQTGGFFSLHIIPGFLPPKPLADLLTIQGGSDKSGILKPVLQNHTAQLKIIRFY